jgi:hypothetical protein
MVEIEKALQVEIVSQRQKVMLRGYPCQGISFFIFIRHRDKTVGCIASFLLPFYGVKPLGKG